MFPSSCPPPGKYQVSILRKLRDINLDYHHVGWYQSTYLGSHVTREFLESHVRYQLAIEESVVLIYGKVWSGGACRSLLFDSRYIYLLSVRP